MASQKRYEQVQQILDAAAGASKATYQGYDKFWHLPLPEFLKVTIYGVRMIAPAPVEGATLASSLMVVPDVSASPPSSCCGGTISAPVTQSVNSVSSRRNPGRGAASGLIKGLKGQPPFDGTQFPPLPWGGRRATASEIETIEGWIDDGCPDEDVKPPIVVKDLPLTALHNGDAEYPPSSRSTNDIHEEAGTLKKRKNIAFLSADELSRFRAAITWMRSFDAYPQDERSFNYWARIHANMCQHGWEEFLTWHRIYLYFFELQLQDFDKSVTLPYWDWTMYDQDWDAKDLDSGTIPTAYQCWIDQPALDRLKGKIPDDILQKLNGIKNKLYNSGLRLFAAGNIPYVPLLNPTTLQPDLNTPTALIVNELRNVNALWHRLRWPGPGNQNKNNLFFEAYPTPDDITHILQLDNFFKFGSGPTNDHFFGALENIHNLIHNFSGGMNPTVANNPAYTNNQNYDPQNRYEPEYGDMVSAGVTAFDPIFWGHHSNVDRLWAEWQTLHPNVNPDNLASTLPPWPMTVGDSLELSNLGYEYVKSEHVFETNNTQPFTRFKSASAGVSNSVLQSHRRAEIRLHKVKFSVHGGGFVRAFLNTPDANVNTPTKGNDHYVGQASLFSGFCVGGPGHCEPPKGDPRKFDKRDRHHKTPGNIRFDATDAVSRLVANGATDLRVNLVVFGLDGKPRSDVLCMSAVSLVFLD
jgi:tyrosinase